MSFLPISQSTRRAAPRAFIGGSKSATELLTSYPHIGSRTDDPVIRRLVATPFPYLIFYEVADDEVIIHAVRHAARKPSSMPGQP